MRYLLDEMYPPAAASALRDRGVDAVAVKELPEVAGAEDATVLCWAHEQQRVVVTENVRDFGRLANVQDHCGVVMCPQTRFTRTASHINKLVEALAKLADDPPHGLGSQPLIWWLES
jgi:predicted nuclease of predicted toxin-antitoxin system